MDPFLRELPLHTPRLWRFALRLTRHQQESEDLLQRTYVRALERRHQWQPASSLISWLFAIMHSIWVNEVQSAYRRKIGQFESDQQWENIAETNASGDPEFSMMCKQIVQAVDSLPEAQRLVMVLIAAEGLSYREAADVLNIPIGTVMSRLARARLMIGEGFRDSRMNEKVGMKNSE